MLNEIRLSQSTFTELDTVGFGVVDILDTGAVPVVVLAAVDCATNAERTVELRPGESVEIAGEVWQLAEIRDPAEEDWTVVLRQVGAG
jgi:hypothetical protein